MPEATLTGGKVVHNLYSLMQIRFQELWIVIVYVLGCISLGYHLAHGFLSAFKTLGVHNKRYIDLLRWLRLCFFNYCSFSICHDAGKFLFRLGEVKS